MISRKEIYFTIISFVLFIISFLVGNFINLKTAFGKIILVCVAGLFTFFLFLQTYTLYESFTVEESESEKQPENKPTGVCWQDGTCA